MPANSKGKMVRNKKAGAKANSKTAGPGGSFPIGDKKHARLAISGATRSERAGNISASTEANIKTKARAELGKGGAKPDSKPASKAAPAKSDGKQAAGMSADDHRMMAQQRRAKGRKNMAMADHHDARADEMDAMAGKTPDRMGGMLRMMG